MKKSVCLSFSLLAIFSLIAVAPSAFAEHGEGGMSATVENAAGSSTPGCEDTADGCIITKVVTLSKADTEVTWENNDTAAHVSQSGSPSEGGDGYWNSGLIMAGHHTLKVLKVLSREHILTFVWFIHG